MGATPSVQLTAPENFQHFGFMFDHIDRFRLIIAPPEIVNATKTIFSEKVNVKKINEQSGFIEFKLSGGLWYASALTDAAIKYIFCTLFKEFYALGWHFKVASDIQCLGRESDSLIFEKGAILESTNVICVSLTDSNRIRLVAPEELIAHVRKLIMTYWPSGIKKEQRIDKSFEFKLCGNPWAKWTSDTEETYHSESLISGLLATFYHLGWVYIVGIKSNYQSDYEFNSLYFRYEPSVLQNIQQYGQSNFFALSLNRSDTIRLINATADTVSLIKSVIPQCWPKGIKKETVIQIAHEFELLDNPWWCDGEEVVHSGRLISGILNSLRQLNWELYTVCKFTLYSSGKSVLYFRSNNQATVKLNRTVCVSLNDSDKIRIMDANENEINGVRDAIVNSWSGGIQDQRIFGMSYEFKLSGYPFTSSGSNNVYAFVTLMYLLANLQNEKLNLICSCKTGNYSSYLDAWFLAGN